MNGKKAICAYFGSLWNRIVLCNRPRNKWKWLAREEVKSCEGLACHYCSEPDYQ